MATPSPPLGVVALPVYTSLYLDTHGHETLGIHEMGEARGGQCDEDNRFVSRKTRK